MAEPGCRNLDEILAELDQAAPGIPLLALGQTIFWDEPMKAGVAQKLKRLGSTRAFLAGVHDTDYFAKLPGGKAGAARYRIVPHNDTTTRGLWSAAGEFSALFGSETVITREMLAAAGLRIEKVSKERPRFLDDATEAFGWRGIVSLEDHPPVTSELPLKGVQQELFGAFDWATRSSIDCLAGEGRAMAEQRIDDLRAAMCDVAEEPNLTLSGFYQRLLPQIYEFASNARTDLKTTATTELLRFNSSTCQLPRFALLEPFVNSTTRMEAKSCYDEAIRGSAGLYELSRFGTGAIPFDLVIPGKGRGTIRLGTRGAVINTPKPQFLSYKKPLGSASELAELVEAKFGNDCVLVGKAVTLIGLLAREFIFVFHEGASSYVRHSRALHQLLKKRLKLALPINPILRVRYDAWDSLSVCCSWLRLPEPLQRPFGTEEVCAPSFADRWRSVGEEQEKTLEHLSQLRRPIELIRFLNANLGGSWHKLAEEYESLHELLSSLNDRLGALRVERDELYSKMRSTRSARTTAERQIGNHFRDRIFRREPSPEDLARRVALIQAVRESDGELADIKLQMRALRQRQHTMTHDAEVRRAHDRRRSIELEAELKRCRLIRGAIISSRGLQKAAVRPSAWWFPLVCPDGLWFRETIEQAQYYLEPLL